MTFGSLFAGIGGIDLGLERAGMKPCWQIEIDPWCRRVLAKQWPDVKRYPDVRGVELFDQETWRKVERLEPVELLAGGFPCQDISTAGKGVGIIGSRSGLWSEFARLVGELRPGFVFAENVPALRSRGLALVLQDLLALGYDAEWHCIPACALGAPHERDRIWIVAYPAGMFREAIIWGEPDRDIQPHVANANGPRQLQPERCEPAERGWFGDGAEEDANLVRGGREGSSERRPVRGFSWSRPPANTPAGLAADPSGQRCDGPFGAVSAGRDSALGSVNANTHSEPLVRAAIARGERSAWTSEPGVVRMVHGISGRVDRLRGLGNSVVPQVVEWIGRRIIQANQ